MADTVDIGLAPNDNRGDVLRTAFTKLNARIELEKSDSIARDALEISNRAARDLEIEVQVSNIAASFNLRTWTTGQSYSPGSIGSLIDRRDAVLVSGVWYVAAVAHTAGSSFATDLSDGNWITTDPVQLRGDLATIGTGKGGEIVAANDGHSGARYTTVQGFLDSPVVDDLVIGNSNTITQAVDGDHLSSVVIRQNSGGRRGELQMVPNDGADGMTRDVAGGELTIMAYDTNGPLGYASNMAFAMYARRVAGMVVAWALRSFGPGSPANVPGTSTPTADVPIQFINDSVGVHASVGTDGSWIFNRLVTLGGRVPNGDGTFISPPNFPRQVVLAGDSPAMDMEERSGDGATLLHQMRIRLVGGEWSLYDVTSGSVPLLYKASEGIRVNVSIKPYSPGTLTIGADASRFERGYFNRLNISGLPAYANDAEAGSAGLSAGEFYKTAAGAVMVKA